jgi:hypothetical protein
LVIVTCSPSSSQRLIKAKRFLKSRTVAFFIVIQICITVAYLSIGDSMFPKRGLPWSSGADAVREMSCCTDRPSKSRAAYLGRGQPLLGFGLLGLLGMEASS